MAPPYSPGMRPEDQAPSQVPVPGFQIVAPPAESHKVEIQGPQTTTKTVAPHPETVEAMADASEAQQSRLNALEGQSRLDEIQAQADALKEERERDIARYMQIEKELLAQKRADALKAKMAEVEKRQGEMMAARKETEKSYWEDPKAPNRVLSAFLTSLDNFTPGNRGASEALEKEMAANKERKLTRLANSQEYLKLAQSNAAAAQAMFDEQEKDISEKEAAIRKLFVQDAAVLSKKLKLPGAKVAFDKLYADQQEKDAEWREKRLARYDQEETQKSAQTTSSHTTNVGGAGQAPNRVERDAAADAQFLVESMQRAKDLISKNPEAYRRMQKALLDWRKVESSTDTSVGRMLTAGGRVFGYIPTGLEQLLKTPEERAIYSAMAPVFTQKSRELDPTGPLNEGAMKTGREALGLASRGPNEMMQEIDVFKDRAQRKVTAAIPGAAPAAPAAAPAPAPTPTTEPAPVAKPDRKAMTSQMTGAAKWLAKNPKHPDAPAVRAKLREMAGGGG